MSKSKSLGSSPIGYSSTGNERYNFIPDLGVSSSKDDDESLSVKSSSSIENNRKRGKIHSLVEPASQKTSKKEKKKIASYYLEKSLITRLKQVSEQHGIYYSTFVSDAIEHWVEEHSYE